MRPLKFKVNDIPPEGIEVIVQIPLDQARARLGELEDQSFLLVGPVSGKIRLEPSGKRVLLRGFIETVIRVACARCLEDFDSKVHEDIFLVFTPFLGSETREELEAEAMNQEIYSGDEIDSWPVIQEHIVLGIPVKSLCREDCVGLCQVCGHNLNLGPCSCRTGEEHPGLAALKVIRDKLPK